MTNGVRTNAPHLVLGLCVMLLGVVLVFDRLGMIDAAQVLRYWPLALVLLGGSMMVQAIRVGPGNTQRADFPVGAVIWLVLLGIVFTQVFERRNNRAGNGDTVKLFAVLSGDRRAPITGPFRGGDMTSVMGGTQLDLRSATMAPGAEAVIDVFALMGGAVVLMPQDWILDIQATAVMGGITDSRRREATLDSSEERTRRFGRRRDDDVPATPPSDVNVERDDQDTSSTSNPPRIVLRGFVMMGGLVIKSSPGDERRDRS